MKALKYLLFLILILIIAVSIYTAIQPSEYDVKRSRVIDVPQQVVYHNIMDYRNWSVWGPWQEQDPSLRYFYPEKSSGIGGSYSWQGKDGPGNMETLNATPYSDIKQKIVFEGFEPAEIYWNLKKVETGTKVTWGMRGRKNFLFKFYTLIGGPMDKIIGPMYERGLEKLDSVLVKDISQYDIQIDGIRQHGGGYYIYKSTSTRMRDAGKAINKLIPELQNFADKNNISTSGAPFIIYHKWDEANDAAIFSACLPTPDRIVMGPGEIDVLTGELTPFKALKTTLTGNYTNLQEAWSTSMDYLKQNELKEDTNGSYIEVYATDTTTQQNPADWVTEIYIPLLEND